MPTSVQHVKFMGLMSVNDFRSKDRSRSRLYLQISTAELCLTACQRQCITAQVVRYQSEVQRVSTCPNLKALHSKT